MLLRGACSRSEMAARRTSPELEVGVRQNPVVQHVRVGQLLKADRRDLLRSTGRRIPSASLEHRIKMRVLRPQTSFTQHHVLEIFFDAGSQREVQTI